MTGDLSRTKGDPVASAATRRGAAAPGTTFRGKPHVAVVLGFCLTVLMGTGGGHALALWNQRATLAIQVKAETLPSPTISCAEIANQPSVVVTWTPQRSGVTSYDVTVARNGSTQKSTTYLPNVTSETITAPGGLANLAYSYTYAVTVTANYGTWQAGPAVQNSIVATKVALAEGDISCP